jgi:hypothetical protein
LNGFVAHGLIALTQPRHAKIGPRGRRAKCAKLAFFCPNSGN